MTMPNNQQIASIIRWLLATGGPVSGLLLAHGATQGDIDQISAVALMVVPPLVSLVWSMIAKTDKSLLATAGAVPGATVVVDPATASAGAKAAAADPAVANVNVKGA